MDDAGMSLQATMTAMGQAARQGAQALRVATPAQRTAALQAMAAAIRADAPAILAANARDLDKAGAGGLTAPMVERLMLNAERLEGVAAGVEAVAAIPDPLGVETARWTRPNGPVRALGQCGDPARRVGMPAVQPRDPRGHRQGAEGGGDLDRRGADRQDAGPRRGGGDPVGPGPHDRPDHPPGRRGAEHTDRI